MPDLTKDVLKAEYDLSGKFADYVNKLSRSTGISPEAALDLKIVNLIYLYYKGDTLYTAE